MHTHRPTVHIRKSFIHYKFIRFSNVLEFRKIYVNFNNNKAVCVSYFYYIGLHNNLLPTIQTGKYPTIGHLVSEVT